MPAQSNRGVWCPISEPGDNPCFSGVRKVILQFRDSTTYAYAYFSAIDCKWFDANGNDISHRVKSFAELSR